MSEFKLLCEKYFGSNNFYDILKVSPKASITEIKKAYHKLSLCVHPDRVDEEEKKVATEKFKVLGRIHSVLQDASKRKLYDDYGQFDEEVDASFNWLDYWRSMFKKIEIEDIKTYEKEYIGSDTELRDIKKAYVSTGGNMDKILEMVPFTNCDDEDRIITIVKRMVDNGEVENYEKFFNESESRKVRRRKKWEKEKRETESIDMKELEKDLERNMRKRRNQFSCLLLDIENKSVSKRKKRDNILATTSPTERKSNKINK